MDNNAMDRSLYTLKERTWLLKLRNNPRTWDYLQKQANVDDEAMSIMLSHLGKLYYVKDNKPLRSGLITLNQMGETVAKAEFDHRFEMYYNRAISFLALIVSIVAIVVSVA